MPWDPRHPNQPLTFWCSVGLHKWQPHHDPHGVHVGWLECARPGCPFMRLEKKPRRK